MVDHERWSWRTHPKRFVAMLIAVTVVMMLIGAGWAVISEKAFGETSVTDARSSGVPW